MMTVYIAKFEARDGEFIYSAHRTMGGAMDRLKQNVALHLYGEDNIRAEELKDLDLDELQDHYAQTSDSLDLGVEKVPLEN